MIRLLQCEWRKTRRCYIFLTALGISTVGLIWALAGNYNEDVLRHGWRMFLYQLPLVNAMFLPMLAMVVSARLCGIEHKNGMQKQLCCMTERGKLYDVKLISGLGIMIICMVFMWCVTVAFGMYKGFAGEFPLKLWLLHLLFTLVPTIVIYIFQHTLSMLFQNQAIAFFAGIFGEFVGIFSMFLASVPFLRKLFLWGYYGELQFVFMFGWTRETRYANAHFDVMPIAWDSFAVLLAEGAVLYALGRYLFRRKEL